MRADLHICRRWLVRSVLAGLPIAASLPVAAQADASSTEPDLPPGIDVGTGALPAEDQVPAHERALGLGVQLWLQHTHQRKAGTLPAGDVQTGRIVLDYRKEWSPSANWHIGFSDRLDVVRALHQDPGTPSANTEINSLREAWASRRLGDPASPYFFDAGRINVRNGVGSGYNPTDFFKTNAVRTATSFDPRDLRFDRLGTVMVRAQHVTQSGAWTVGVAPQLSNRDDFDDRTFALGLERTNRQPAVYAKWAPQLSERFSVDALAFTRQDERPQLGLNATWLATDALIVNGEWAGGQVRPLVGPFEAPPALDWRNRAAVNLTWTTPVGLELTTEYQYAGDALSKQAWREWRNVDSPQAQLALAQLVLQRAGAREPLVDSGWFVRAAWQDVFAVRGVDASAFTQVNAYDASGAWQIRVTWRIDQRWSLTGQAGGNTGSRASEFGSIPLQGYTSVYLAGSL
jgi:hypothetical protein